MRTIEDTAHGNSADGASQLYRAGGDRALADAYRDDLTGIPFLAQVLDLPLLGRHQAADFAGQVDAGLLSHAQGRRPFRDLCDAHALRQREEECIARLINSVVKVGAAFFFTLAERMGIAK